jgi:alkanesulfonate monooxygenase SsuD/methylene tetrahydromethanopterin reductase-like flavin-dependent oxidoreductase (luciferase family)
VQIGLYIRLLGRPGTEPPPPSWTSIRDQAIAAEAAGFDLVVLEDASLYPDVAGDVGLWEAVATAGAVAASTERLRVAHAVINNPYRYPTQTARIAATLDEISGGRYTLGIGSGNTPDDYPRFGIAADRRFSRFSEAIRIIRDLLRGERVTFDGEFYSVAGAELVLRGPSPNGPPIAIAAGKPRMLELAAELADEWNWWIAGPEDLEALARLVHDVERTCAGRGRDPASLRRSVDVYSVMAPTTEPPTDAWPISGPADAIADALLEFGRIGFDEVRINLKAPGSMPQAEAIASMAEVVALVHTGT